MNRIQWVEQLDGFEDLTYNQQVEARSKAFGEMLAQDQVLANMAPEEQEKVYNTLVMKPPKFQNPQLQQKMAQVGQAIAAGDEAAIDFAEKEVRLGVLGKSSLIANAVDRYLISPYMEHLEAQGIHPQEVDHADILKDPEREKAVGYMDMMLSTDRQRARKLSTQKTAIGLGATLVEFAGLTLLGAGTVRAPRALGKLFTRGAVKAMDPALSAVRTARGFAWQGLRLGVQHAAATAVIGTAWEGTQYAMNDLAQEDPEVADLLLKGAKWYGAYFLGDIAFNTITDVMLPMGKSLGKNFTGWGDLSKKMIAASRGDFKAAMQTTFTGKNMDPVLWARLDDTQRALVKSRQAAIQTYKNVERLTPLGAQRIVANSYGFGFETLDDGRIKIFDPDGKNVKYFSGLEESDKYISDRVRGLENDFSTLMDEGATGAIAQARGWGKARSLFTGTLEKMPEDSKQLLSQAIAPQGGYYTPGQLEAFGKLYLRGTGAPKGLERTVQIGRTGKNLTLKVRGQEIAQVPKGRVSPQMEKRIMKDLLSGMEKVGGRNPQGIIADVGELLALQRERRIFTPGFVDDMAQRSNLGARLEVLQGGAGYKIAGKEFSSLESAGDYVLNNTLSFEDAAKHFSHNWGLKLTRLESGGVTLREGAKIIDQANTLGELFERLPHYQPKIPKWMGPRFSVIDSKVALTFQDGIVSGHSDELLRFFDQFEDIDLGVKRIVKSTGQELEINPLHGQVEVSIPQIGHRQVFDNMADARKALEGWTDLDALTDAAARRGYRIEHAGGSYLVYSSDGAPKLARNINELQEVIKNRPLTKWAPELTGVDENLLKIMKKPTMDGWQKEWLSAEGTEPMENTSFITDVLETVSPQRTHFERMAKELGDEAILEQYNKVRTMQDWIGGQISEQERLVHTIFSKKNGQGIKKKRRRHILRYVRTEATDADAAKRFATEAKLTPEELESAEMLKKFLGENEESGLAGYFGLSPRQFLLHYVPEIKNTVKKSAKNQDFWFSDGNIHGLIDASNVSVDEATKLKAFFEYSRTSDLQQLALEEDPLRILTSYIHQGHKSQYLKPVISDVFETLKREGTANAQIGKEFNNYVATLYGFPQSWSERQIRKATESLWRDLGMKGQAPKDISRMVMNWGYTAALGLRPALAVRNSMQIWMTLAPIVGNQNVAKAVGKVAANELTGFNWVDDALKAQAKQNGLNRVLKQKNIIKGSLPVFGGELYPTDSFMHKALSMYGNSDDFTRAVSWVAAKDKFDWALKRFQASSKAGAKGGKLSQKEFMSLSGMNRMSPDVKTDIMKKIESGQWEAAGDTFAEKITAETMFLYEKAESPKTFRGGVGKIFGMFGTFPVYFVDNIRRQLRYATKEETAGFITTWLANSAALYGAFASVGVEMNDFKPWNPLIFTGGPYYELFNKVLAAAGGDQQELANLTGLRNKDGDVVWMPERSELLQWSIPYSLAIKDMAEGISMATQGDYYNAFLTSTGFTLRERPN